MDQELQMISMEKLSAMSPKIGELLGRAYLYYASGMFKDLKSYAQAAVKMQIGRELGLPDTVSLRGIDLIEGHIELKPSLLAGLVKNGKKYDYEIIEINNDRCIIDFIDITTGKVLGRSSFGKEDAERIGNSTKSNYSKYPRNMYFARAMSNGIKWWCPDISFGPIYSTGEISGKGNDIDEEQLLNGMLGNDSDPVGTPPPAVQQLVLELDATIIEDKPIGGNPFPMDFMMAQVTAVPTRNPDLIKKAAELTSKLGATHDEICKLRSMFTDPIFSEEDLKIKMNQLEQV